MISSSGSSPMPCSTSWSRTDRLAVRNASTCLVSRHRGDAHGRLRAGLLLRADGRRPGLHAEDLLRARAAGHRRPVWLRLRRDHGHPASAHARLALRPALLRRHPPQPGPRRRRAHHGLDLGEGELGALVGVGRADARVLPGRLPALRHLPAAALLDRGPRAPGALRERVRHRGRSLRAAELPGGAPRAVLYPSARLRDGRRRPTGEDAVALLPLPHRHGGALRHPVEVRDDLQAHLRTAALAAAQAGRRRSRRSARPQRGTEPRDERVTDALPDNTGYVAAAYLVFLALVLIYLVVMAAKLARFERELAELNELAEDREPADEREPVRT